MTSSKELRTAEKEMRKADKQFAAAEKAYEKGNVKAGEKHENRANALAASAQEHAAHAQQVGILSTGVTAPHSVHGAHHGGFSNAGAWNGGFMNVAPTTAYRGTPVGNYNPTHTYAQDHPYHHSNFAHNGTPLGEYNVGSTYAQDHPYSNSTARAAGLTTAATPLATGLTTAPLSSGLTSAPLSSGLSNVVIPASGIPLTAGLGAGLGAHHGSYSNGLWNGGFMNTAPTTLYQGHPIGNYDPFHTYAAGHPYHHSNYQYNGQPLGAYQAGTNYPSGHPYHGLGASSGLGSGIGSGLGSGLGVSPFGKYHNSGGFYDVAPTTQYQGQAIGNYNPLTTYAQGHPYHHSNFQYNGQPLGAYQSGTSYPQGHPYYGLGSSGTGLGSVLSSGLGSGLGSGLTSSTSPFGQYHNTGGFYNVAPTSLYQGQAIGNYNPLTAYAQDHPYHHSNFKYNGQPLGAYNAATSYPQGHPYHGFGSGAGLSSGIGSGLTSGLGSGLASSASPFGQYHNTGGFYNVAPTTLYKGQAIGNYNPSTSYQQDHPYHHSNFQYNNQPLGAYNASTTYPQGHPYHGFGSGSGLTSGLGSGLASGHASPFGQYHNTGGFFNVPPTTLYNGQPIGNYNPLTTYAQEHPYHHSRFTHNGKPLEAYNASTTYPQGHPYYGLGSGSGLSSGLSGLSLGGASPFGQYHGSGGFYNVAPTTLYQGQPIGNYNPATSYAADHPYHHSHFQHQGQPLGAYQAGTVYPQGHPYYGFGDLNRGTATPTVTGHTYVPYTSPFGANHGTWVGDQWVGGLFNVAPSTVYNGHAIGNYNPSFNYPQDHPYHHSHHNHNGSPLGAYTAGTNYPQGHPFYGRGLTSTSAGLGSGVASALGSGIGGLGSGAGLSSGLGSTFGRSHGSFANGKWNGGFMDVDPITAYNGQAVGNYDPNHDYPADHPYHHSKFQYNNQPLGRFQRGTQYPQGHPYFGIL